jgi:hypothetical protein
MRRPPECAPRRRGKSRGNAEAGKEKLVAGVRALVASRVLEGSGWTGREIERQVIGMAVKLNRREAATVIAGLRLLAGDGVRVRNYPRLLVAGLGRYAEPDYELRYEADEDYVRELIERVEAMWLQGARLCCRCASRHPGKWLAKSGAVQCAECERTVSRHFVLTKPAGISRRTSRGIP